MRTLTTIGFLIASATIASAAAPSKGACPSNAPEGYKWLSSYVDEYKKTGKVSDWFSGSLKEHPKDQALMALDAYFKGKADWNAGWDIYASKGGKPADYANGLACAKVKP
jgi:hypothetical protein